MSTPTLHDMSNPVEKAGRSPPSNANSSPASINDTEAQAPLKEAASTHDAAHDHTLAKLGDARKNFLLFIFAISTFVDVCNVSGVAIAVAQIGTDIKLGISQLVWIITSYSLCFAAFLLFGGRLSDLFPAKIVFIGGFFFLGVFSLVTSFVTSSKYGFLILRGLGGIAGSMTIPSAYHLTVHMFPDPTIQQAKLSLLGLSGAVGNMLGLVLAGICMLANYKWFFRVIAILCIGFSIITYVLLPYVPSTYSKGTDRTPRWKRLDIVGVVIMMGALICFILSLTQGPIDGWSSASFIAPFVLSIPLAIAFFVWEARIPPTSAVLPSSVWQITNIIISSLVVLFPFAFWATSQLQYATFWQEVLGWKPIHVAAAMLPQGIIALIVGGVAQAVPQIITKPRITIPVAAVVMIAAEILQIYSNGGRGKDYWRYCFPAFLLGSSAAVTSYFASAINLISYCPPEMAGVAGAWTQVLSQVGGAVVLAVQAGLQTDNLADWKKSSGRAYWFMVAWVAVLALQFVVFYKTPGTPEEEHELARKRIRESGKGEGVVSVAE